MVLERHCYKTCHEDCADHLQCKCVSSADIVLLLRDVIDLHRDISASLVEKGESYVILTV